MRILLFGREGQLGAELGHVLLERGELLALGRDGGDLSEPERLAQTIRDQQPDLVVNAAAYTAVDRAESEPDLARLVNCTAVSAMAGACHETGARLVHYSTDYVFDGSGERPWTETDATAPLNVYGVTKRDGEDAIRASGCNHLILRVSWLYAPRRTNFLRTILRLAREREEIGIVADQIGAPTSARFVAEATRTLIGGRGIYHLAPHGWASWFDYARLIVDTAREAGADLRVRAINPIATADYPTPAKRPLNSRLATGKVEREFSLTLPPWQDDVIATVRELVAAEREAVGAHR